MEHNEQYQETINPSGSPSYTNANSTHKKRATVFDNAKKTSGKVFFITGMSLQDILTRASELLLDKHNENATEVFTRVFNAKGGEITDPDTILHDETLYFSRGEDFATISRTPADFMEQPSTVIPTRETTQLVLRHLFTLTENESATKLRFMADYDTFAHDVRPILEQRYMNGEEMLSQLWEVFINHGSPFMHETEQERSTVNQLTSANNTNSTLRAPPPFSNNNETTKETQKDKEKTKQKRALTGFNLFYRDKCKEFREGQHDFQPNASGGESGRIAPRIAKAWKNLSEEERRSYHEQARIRQQQQLISGLQSKKSQTNKQDQTSPPPSANGNLRFYNYSAPSPQSQPPPPQSPIHIPSISAITGIAPSQHPHQRHFSSPTSDSFFRERPQYDQNNSILSHLPSMPSMYSDEPQEVFIHQPQTRAPYPPAPRHVQGSPHVYHDGYMQTPTRGPPPPPPPTHILPPPLFAPRHPQQQSPYEDTDQPPIKKQRYQ